MIVVECYCFLIDIIVEPGVPRPPPFYLTQLMFSVLTCNKPLTKRWGPRLGLLLLQPCYHSFCLVKITTFGHFGILPCVSNIFAFSPVFFLHFLLQSPSALLSKSYIGRPVLQRGARSHKNADLFQVARPCLQRALPATLSLCWCF